jgi:glycerol transport system ATP-binding protein
LNQLAHNEPVQLGLRASVLRTEQRPTDLAMPGRVQLAEISGTDTFVHLDCGGLELVLQKTGVHGFDIGQALNVYIDPQDAYVFDAAGHLLRLPLNPFQGGH